MSAYFISATGTDIGKTFVAAGLIRYLRSGGAPVSALKPVLSGFDAAASKTSDAGILLDALGEANTLENLDRMSAWRFSAPLSPNMAAAREGRRIDFAALTMLCREAVAAHRGTLLIEGVGGVMVPLDDHHTVLDWMAALNLPVLLVSGSYLGTISHTLTAYQALASRGLRIVSLILNDTLSSVPLDETAATIARFVPKVPITIMPRVTHWQQAQAAFAHIYTALS